MTALHRPVVVAAARIANAIFFLGVYAYGVLASSPFAYNQFIKPDVVPAIGELVHIAPALFWLVLLITIFTLLPQLQAPARSRAAVAYAVVWTTVGVWVVVRPVITLIDGGPLGLVIALLALTSPISLSAVDHVVFPAPSTTPSDRYRAFEAALLAGAAAWAIYAVAVPIRLRQAVGINLSAVDLALGLASSAAVVVLIFAAMFLVALAIMAIARFGRWRARIEYWSLVGTLAAITAGVMYALVCASIAFTGGAAALASAGCGVAVAAVWADLARVRASTASRDGTLEALALFVAPVAGRAPHSRRVTIALLVALSAAAFLLVDVVAQFDWNFLMQKLGVLVVWLAAFGVIHAAVPPRVNRRRVAVAGVCIIAAGVAIVVVPAAARMRVPEAAFALDRYAAVDPSFRLIRDASIVPSGETARFYTYLRAHTLISSLAVPPTDVDFVAGLRRTPGPKPFIFLFIVDSLRRDYLSPYNAAVTFTPQIARLASESVVFNRAFTRYAGTALAVPSIWAGGMLLHELQQHDFARHNTLLKLIDAEGYHTVLTMDHLVHELVPHRPDVTELDPQLGTMDVDLCRTVDELEAMLSRTDDPRPMFVYTLPQNVHIAVASRRKVGADESYPGFFAPVASSLRRVDGCIGGFIDDLKRSNLFDRSIIILTADHGDSLGEGGRWGHAYFMYPEVMRVPLIVHLPPAMAASLVADPGRLAFSTDITPTLYALLGHPPADLGRIFGRPLFVRPGTDVSPRRRQDFLLASSYGAVYGMLRMNGGEMYVADAVDAQEYAVDMTGEPAVRVALTRDRIAADRRRIEEQIGEIDARYHFSSR
jgi:sulfatase-like protein